LQIYEFISFVQSKSTKKTEKKWSKKRTYLSVLCKRLIITNWRWTTSREALSFLPNSRGSMKARYNTYSPTIPLYNPILLTLFHRTTTVMKD